jgi:hypothetical protein
MTKINQTYSYSRHTSVASSPDIVELSTNRLVTQPTAPPAVDKITLSNAGLEAAARFSNYVQRSANTYTLALPAPHTISPSSDFHVTEPVHETPASRNLVRTTYAEQQKSVVPEQAFPGSRINILV